MSIKAVTVATLLAAVIVLMVPADSSVAGQTHLGGHGVSADGSVTVDYDSSYGDAPGGILQIQLDVSSASSNLTILITQDSGLAGSYFVRNESKLLIELDSALAAGACLVSVTSSKDGMIAEARFTVSSSYTATFDGNGAKGWIPFVSVEAGDRLTLPGCDLKSPNGEPFTGWSVGDTVYREGDSVTLSSDTAYLAVWGSVPGPIDTDGDDSTMLIVIGAVLVAALAILIIWTVRKR